MHLLTSLLLLILAARFIGGVSSRLGQPAILGEILAGIILGPSLMDLVQPTAELSGISALAVFLVVFKAGLEMEFKKVIRAFRGKGLIIAGFGFLVPLSGGLMVGLLFQMDVMHTVFLGLCISITAMPVAIRILEGFKILDSVIASYSISTGILNDVWALLALGVILDLPEQKSFQMAAFSILAGVGKLLLLAGIILLADWVLRKVARLGVDLPRLLDRFLQWAGAEALFGVAVIFVMAFSSLSENLGFHAVIGAFFGALLLSRDLFGVSHFSNLNHTLESISDGFLAPIFFTYLGLEFNLKALHSPIFVGIVLVTALASKVAGGYWGGRFCGLSERDSFGIGLIINGRGIMELVVANVALQKGFIGPQIFSLLVLVGMVTTFITPLAFRLFLKRYPAPI